MRVERLRVLWLLLKQLLPLRNARTDPKECKRRDPSFYSFQKVALRRLPVSRRSAFYCRKSKLVIAFLKMRFLVNVYTYSLFGAAVT